MTSPDKLRAALESHNPYNPEEMVDPYPLYAEARRGAPVFWNAPSSCWIVTRAEDIAAILRDTQRFSSAYLMSPRTPPPPEVVAVLGSPDARLPSLLTTDPPDHARLRSLLTKGLSAQRTASMEPGIRALAEELIDGFIGSGRADLMVEFAFPFTAAVIGDLLGMPRADIPRLKRWSDDWIKLVWNVAPLPELVDAAKGLVAFQRYFAEVIEERRRKPGDDLLSSLIQAHLDDNARLSEEELIAVPMQIIMAGHETTFYLIANTLALLLQHPAHMGAALSDPGSIGVMIEEVLRLDAPLLAVGRRAMVDVEMGGVTIPKGANLQVAISAANHDESVFPDPTAFNVDRQNVDRHFSFGRGIHFCLGAPLARLESRIALERLLARLPNLRLNPEETLERARVIGFRGFEHMHALWDPHDRRT